MCLTCLFLLRYLDTSYMRNTNISPSPVHHHLHQEVSHSVGHQLDAPGHDPVDARQDEDAVPDPEDGEHLEHNTGDDASDDSEADLVVDHVEREDAERPLGLLTTPPAIPLVVTHSHCNVNLTLWDSRLNCYL